MKNNRLPSTKAAKQERSKVSVASILEAMAALLKEHGYAYANTNRIAEKAGVSIGTLYNYFSNREAVALSLYEDTSSKASLKMKKIMAANIDKSIEESCSVLMRELLNTYKENKEVLINLLEEAPELRELCIPFSFDNLIRGNVKIYLLQRDLINENSSSEKMVYLLEGAILGNIRRHLQEGPDSIMSDEEFVDELSFMIISYLNKGLTINSH